MEKLEKLLETVLDQQNYSPETQKFLDRVKINSQRQKRLYEGILSNTPDWAYILDPSHRFIYANSSLLKAIDKSRDEIIGTKISDLVSTSLDQQIQEINEVIATKEQVRGELRIEDEEGEKIFDYIFVPILKDNGEVEAVAGTSRNITGRIRAEQELEKELLRMRSLQKMSADLMLHGDIQAQLDKVLHTLLKIMDADKGAVYILKQDSDQLVIRAYKGYSQSFVNTYRKFNKDSSPFPLETLEENEQLTVHDIENSSLLDTKLQKKFIQEGVHAAQLTLLRSRDNELLGVLAINWNNRYHISERQHSLRKLLARQVSNWIDQYRVNRDLRNTRQRLKKANNFLEERIKKRTEKLQERASKMQDLAARLTSAKQQERKRIATVLHDDLQQLLVSAKMHIGFLTENEPESENADKALSMLDQAVEVSRNLTSRLHPPALHEDGFLAALRWLASDMKERHHLDVEVNIEGKSIEQPLNDEIKVLLFECSRELLFNIVKYADVHEASIYIDKHDDNLQVTIEDEGKGFNVEEARAQTQSFGLFSVLERLEAFGGSAQIQSAPGKGTTIQLKVPVIKDQDHKENNHQDPSSANNYISVLIVDDLAMVREGIHNILQTDDRLKLGEAKDGMEAITKLEEESYDVVLMDVQTPRMNGIEATKQIQKRWPDTYVIGMSAREDENTIKAMREAGAKRFIPKSGDSKQMIKIIADVAAQYEG